MRTYSTAQHTLVSQINTRKCPDAAEMQLLVALLELCLDLMSSMQICAAIGCCRSCWSLAASTMSYALLFSCRDIPVPAWGPYSCPPSANTAQLQHWNKQINQIHIGSDIPATMSGSEGHQCHDTRTKYLQCTKTFSFLALNFLMKWIASWYASMGGS